MLSECTTNSISGSVVQVDGLNTIVALGSVLSRFSLVHTTDDRLNHETAAWCYVIFTVLRFDDSL